jgi:hypothetical protein
MHIRNRWAALVACLMVLTGCIETVGPEKNKMSAPKGTLTVVLHVAVEPRQFMPNLNLTVKVGEQERTMWCGHLHLPERAPGRRTQRCRGVRPLHSVPVHGSGKGSHHLTAPVRPHHPPVERCGDEGSGASHIQVRTLKVRHGGSHEGSR